MKKRFVLFSLLIVLLLSLPCGAQEPARQFIAAMEAYKSGDYVTAIAGLEGIAQQGVRNGQLYYNLGNAHLKNDDLGGAILWYERAWQLIPNDPDHIGVYLSAFSYLENAERAGVKIYRYQPGFNTGLGFEGITIAILARTHPMGVVPAALLVGAMKAGANQMQFQAGVATDIIDVIMALMLFFVAADIILAKFLPARGAGGQNPILAAGWGKD